MADETEVRTFFRIRDWHKIYENNRTRELKHLDWVPLINCMGTDGYAELLDHPDGAAHWGLWCSLILVASRCDPRGTLLRDGGVPHSHHSIARQCRIPALTCEIALQRFRSVGWLEELPFTKQGLSTLARNPHNGAGSSRNVAVIPHDHASSRARGKGREGKGITPPVSPSTEGDPPHKTSRAERQHREVVNEIRKRTEESAPR